MDESYVKSREGIEYNAAQSEQKKKQALPMLASSVHFFVTVFALLYSLL